MNKPIFTYPDADAIAEAAQAAQEELNEQQDISKYFLDYSEDIQKPVSVINDPLDMDKIIVSEGNIFTIVGEAKSYKSTLASRLVIDFLEQHPTEKCILFDTEQADWNVSNVARRICRGMGWNYKDAMAKGQLKICNLRPYSFSERKKAVQMIIEQEKPKLSVIDGIRDLVHDINSQEEATDISDMLLKLTGELTCAIGCIIHTNKDGETTRGCIGTEMINKSESILFCKRRENGKGVHVTMKPSRNEMIEPFDIEMDSRLVPVRVTPQKAAQLLKCGTPKESAALNELKQKKDTPKHEWVNDIRTAGNMCAEATALKWFSDYVQAGYLVKSSKEGDFYSHYLTTKTGIPQEQQVVKLPELPMTDKIDESTDAPF